MPALFFSGSGNQKPSQNVTSNQFQLPTPQTLKKYLPRVKKGGPGGGTFPRESSKIDPWAKQGEQSLKMVPRCPRVVPADTKVELKCSKES